MAAGLADDDDEGRNKIINDDLSRWTRVMHDLILVKIK
jgi:hypothetical protein